MKPRTVLNPERLIDFRVHLSADLVRQLKIHQLKYAFTEKADALTDILTRFFLAERMAGRE